MGQRSRSFQEASGGIGVVGLDHLGLGGSASPWEHYTCFSASILIPDAVCYGLNVFVPLPQIDMLKS